MYHKQFAMPEVLNLQSTVQILPLGQDIWQCGSSGTTPPHPAKFPDPGKALGTAHWIVCLISPCRVRWGSCWAPGHNPSMGGQEEVASGLLGPILVGGGRPAEPNAVHVEAAPRPRTQSWHKEQGTDVARTQGLIWVLRTPSGPQTSCGHLSGSQGQNVEHYCAMAFISQHWKNTVRKRTYCPLASVTSGLSATSSNNRKHGVWPLMTRKKQGILNSLQICKN